MSEFVRCPTCDKVECFGHDEGFCMVLIRNDFAKECPFFKTKEQVAREREYCQMRMAELRVNKEN